MIKFSHHNHSTFSDGKDSLEDMIEYAIENGFTHYVVSDHIFDELCPNDSLNIKDYDRYIETIEELKEKHKHKIQIYSGIETEWYLGGTTGNTGFELLKDRLDFVVGSVHYMRVREVDYSIDYHKEEFEKCLNVGYLGDIRAMVQDYFRAVVEMACYIRPSIIAHIDIIQKNNANGRYFLGNEDWLLDIYENLASFIAKEDFICEVNGGGHYRYEEVGMYPSPTLMSYFLKYGVKMTVGLDAHGKDMLTSYYDESLRYLSENGYDEVYYYDNAEWKCEKIDRLCL